ncbi:MAG: hypothetical protein ABI690_25300 [Chloroflexota bacterium]
MHSSSLSRKSRNRIWFFIVLIVAVISWIVIQTVQAASIYIVDANGSNRSSVVLIGSNPVVSYYDTVNKDLMLAVCGDAACTTFTNTIRQIDTTITASTSSVVVNVGGNPLIAYEDFTNADLKVAACSDPTCATPPTITTIDDTIVSTSLFSMTVIGGNPAIAYQDSPNQDLNLAICVDPACAVPATIRVLDASAGNVGAISSIASLGGNPVVSYQDATAKNLRLASCSNPTCSTAPTITTVASLAGVGPIGGESSMLIVGGNPLIAYEPTGGSGLKIAACVNATCSAGTVISTIDTADTTGLSLAMVNGLPVVSYGAYVSGQYKLRLATCASLTCTSSTVTTLTGVLDAGIYPSIISVHNYPAISYFDNRNNQLRFYFGGDEGYGLTTTPTPSPTITPTNTATATPTAYATPAQVGTLIPLAPANSDAYGTSVAVSGDTIVVGAPNNDHDGLTDAGKIYVYLWNGTIWALQAELTPSDAAASDNFGGSVGIYGDTIIAGAAGDDDGGSASGSAYIFNRSGVTWTQQAKITAPDDDANDRFGTSVAISVDTVLVGAPGDNEAAAGAGAAYIFTRTGSDWSIQQKLLANDLVAGSTFGTAVDLYADTAVIGAPHPDTQTGSAYVFVRAWFTTTWTQQQKLLPDTNIVGVGDHYGASVAVYNETIAVGAPESEGSIGLSVDDGNITVFNRLNGVWSRDSAYNYAIPSAAPSSEPQHGAAAVDVYRETFLAGVPGHWLVSGQVPGAAFVLGKSSYIVGSWLAGTPAANHAQVGASVARDGNTVVVGAPADDFVGHTDSGAVYIFRVIAPPWQPTASVTPSLTPSPTLTLTPSDTPESTNAPESTETPSPTLTPSNTPVTPTSPPDSAASSHFFAVHYPTLTWNRITWALGYQIQIDDDPNFGSPIPVPDEFSASTLSYTTDAELANGAYFWRVRAKKSATDWGDWSATETIIVSAP